MTKKPDSVEMIAGHGLRARNSVERLPPQRADELREFKTLSRCIISGVAVCSGPPASCVAPIDDNVARCSVCLGYVNTFTAYLLTKNDQYRLLLRSL
jgi:hypothetical protein